MEPANKRWKGDLVEPEPEEDEEESNESSTDDDEDEDDDEEYDDDDADSAQSDDNLKSRWDHLIASAYNPDGTKIVSGKIEKITLKNFMCHSNLEVEFNSRLNFLTGQNGSGKSAIMAAIMFCLGAAARKTDRGASAKTFIKNGQGAAKTEITLSNGGLISFEPETYGNSITIERTVSAGSSSYVIKNELGIIISKKVSDVRRILTTLNIQVENPAFLLTQENAKKFLKANNPYKNYELFLYAGSLKSFMDVIDCCEERLKEKMIIYRNKKSNEKLLDVETKHYEKRVKTLKGIADLNRQIHFMECQSRWRDVSDHEKSLQDTKGAIVALTKEKTIVEEKVGTKEATRQELDKKLSELKVQKLEKDNVISAGDQKHREILQNLHVTNEKIREINLTIEKLTKKMKRKEQEANSLREHIKQQPLNDVQKLRAENEAKIQKLSHELQMIQSASINVELNELNNKRLHYETEYETHQRELNKHKQTIKQLQQKLMSLSTEASLNNLAVYHPQMPALIKAINQLYNDGRLSAKPYGPIGQYVNVRDKKYMDIIESHISSAAHAIMVNTNADRLILSEMIERKFPDMSVFLVRYEFSNNFYDISSGKVTDSIKGTRVMVDEIICDVPTVYNYLIDSLSLETILITENSDLGFDLTRDCENVPRHLTRVMVVQPPDKPSLMFMPDPQFRQICSQQRSARILQRDTKELKSSLENEIHLATEKSIDIDKQMKTIGAKLSSIIEDIKRKQIYEKDTFYKIIQFKNEIQTLEMNEYPEDPNIFIHNLKQSIETLMKEIEIDKQQMIQFETELKDLTQLKSEREQEKSQQVEINQEIMRQMKQLINEIESLKMECDLTEARNEENIKKKQEIDRKLKELEIEKKDKMKLIDAAIAKAQEKGERSHTELTQYELKRKIDKLKAQIKYAASLKWQDIDTLKTMIENNTEIKKKVRKDRIRLRRDLNKLNSFQLQMVNELKKVKLKKSDRINEKFQNLLEVRNFSGQIVTDHDAETMTISIVPRPVTDSTASEHIVAKASALSGGERSFATVCFLISLWSVVEHPFFCLDEFDVFTDEINREYLTKLLISDGRAHQDRQYIFISPLEMNLKSSDDMKIHKFVKQ